MVKLKSWYAWRTNRNEFKRDLSAFLKIFGINPCPTTIKNPQANSILGRVYQVIDDILRTKTLQDHAFNDMDTWSALLLIVAWAVYSTHHTTTPTTPEN